MPFLFLLHNLHYEIIKYLDEEDIINLFSISKECFKIDYKFLLKYEIYEEICDNEHFKKFYPDSIKISEDSDIVITPEIAFMSKIYVYYNYFISNKCVAKIFTNLHLINHECTSSSDSENNETESSTSSDSENIVLSQYIIKNLSVSSLYYANISINCIEMNQLKIERSDNLTITLENVSPDTKMYFMMEYCNNIKILGIPENNKIYFKAFGCNEIITDAPVECQIISIKNKPTLLSRKYILNDIYTARDLESLGTDIVKKIRSGFLDLDNLSQNFVKKLSLSVYTPQPNEDNYLISNDPLYNSLFLPELKPHNITSIYGITKKFLKIVNSRCSGLVINNSQIDIFRARGNFLYLHIENIVSKEINIQDMHDFCANNCKINNLYYINENRYGSTIAISNCDIDFFYTGIYTKIISDFFKIKCIMYNISVNFIYSKTLEELSKINCTLQNLENNTYIIKQIVYLPNISKKYVITNINCKFIEIHTNDVEEITIHLDLYSTSSFSVGNPMIIIECGPIESANIIGNPKIIEITKEAVKIVTINGVKLAKQSLYRLRKTAYSMNQYVLNYE